MNFEEDWKLITFFIGGNDLCDLDSEVDSKPENYIQNVQKALDYLHEQVGKYGVVKDGSTVRYGTSQFLLISTVRWYVRLFCNGTGTVLWYTV